MADARYVARRVSDRIDRDFPARATLPAGTPCEGLAFVGRTVPLPDLRPLREHICAMWQGPIAPQPGAPLILLVAFDRAIVTDDAWPGALPLVAADGFAWRSFVPEGAAGRLPSASAQPGPRWIDLWWNGTRQRVAVDALDSLPIAGLWDIPMLEVHPPAPRVHRSPSAGGAARRGGGTTPGDGGERATDGGVDATDGLSPVSTTPVPIDSIKGKSLAGMTDALEQRREKFSLGGLLASLFRPLGPASGGGQSAGAGSSDARQRTPRSPGALANLMGWLKWHNPLSGAIQEKFSGRLKQVEKLIESGEIDAALKLALRLGSGKSDNVPKRYPNDLPPGRATLDFDLASQGFAVPILGDQLFVSIQWRYRELADKLEQDGDFRRAAYIHSQLLNDHARAVDVLEKGKLYLDAARLALDARLEPAIAIALFFKAGELDTALALAKRTACFERLAEHSRDKGGSYHAYVMKAWTDMLVATGQRLRALQVTDQLANDAAADPALLAERRRWLVMALHDAAGDALDAELIARALLTARWDGDLSTRGLEEFPYMAAIGGERPFAMVLDQLQSVMRGDGADARDSLIDLLIRLGRVATPKGPEQAGFWSGPAPIVVERFARALIEHASTGLTQADFQALHTLLGMAGLPVLAADLGKLGKLHAAPAKAAGEWIVPPATVKRAVVRHACLLADGAILAWRDGDQLDLLDCNGTSLWTRTASKVLGLVAIGTSLDVIVIQAERDGARTLSRFSSHRRTFAALGKIELIAWHDVTSDSQWLVQIGGTIGALDLVKLCNATPEFAFDWSCALTERLRVLSFADFPHAPSWVTCDISPDRAGLIERWSLKSLAQLTTQLCVPPHSADDPATLRPTEWHWDQAVMGATDNSQRWMRVTPWTLAEERAASQFCAARREAGIDTVDTFQPRDRDRPLVLRTLADEAEDALTTIAAKGAQSAVAKLRHRIDCPLRLIARHMPATANTGGKSATAKGIVLFADDDGRLFKVDVSTSRITVL